MNKWMVRLWGWLALVALAALIGSSVWSAEPNAPGEESRAAPLMFGEPFYLPRGPLVTDRPISPDPKLAREALHGFFRTSDDAYIEGTVAPVSARVPGQVFEVLARDNESVKGGQVLVRLDARDYRARVEQAKAAVASNGHGSAAHLVAG